MNVSPGSLSPGRRLNRALNKTVEERMPLEELIFALKRQSNLREQAIYSMYHNFLFKLKKIEDQKERLKSQLEKEKQAAKRWYQTATERIGQPTLRRSKDGKIEGDTAKLKNPELETTSPYEMTKERVPTYIALMQQLYALEALTDSILINMKKRCGKKCDNIRAMDYFRNDKSKFRLYAESLLRDLVDHLQGNRSKGIFGLADLSGRNIAKAYIINKLVSFFENYKTAQEYHNILFLGNAGTGKSFLANIFGNILASSGILLTNNVLEKTRSDFVGEYMGQTAIKTNALLSSAYEGVLFFDEAYDIARFDREKNDWDSYGAEAVTEMIQFLSANKGCIAVFAAGYKNDMLTRFLEINEGMRRRFPQQIYLEDYSWYQLYDMLQKNMKKHYGGKVSWNPRIGPMIQLLYTKGIGVSFHSKRPKQEEEKTLYEHYKHYFELMQKGLPFKYIQDRLKKDNVDVEILNVDVKNSKTLTLREFNELKHGSSQVKVKELLFNNQAGDMQNISDRLLSWLTLTGRSPYYFKNNKVQQRSIDIHAEDVAYILYRYGLQKNISVNPDSFLDIFDQLGISIDDAKSRLHQQSASEDVQFERIEDTAAPSTQQPFVESAAAPKLFEWSLLRYIKPTPSYKNHILSHANNLSLFKQNKYTTIKRWYHKIIQKRSRKQLEKEFEQKWKAYHQLNDNWDPKHVKGKAFWNTITNKKRLIDYILWIDWETATCWHEEVLDRIDEDVKMETIHCRVPCQPKGEKEGKRYCRLFTGNDCDPECANT